MAKLVRWLPTSTSVAGQLAVRAFRLRWFSDFRALLPHVEAVCIALFPDLLHHRVGMACLRAGVHVDDRKADRRQPGWGGHRADPRLPRSAQRPAAGGPSSGRFNPAFLGEFAQVVPMREGCARSTPAKAPMPIPRNDVSVVLDLDDPVTSESGASSSAQASVVAAGGGSGGRSAGGADRLRQCLS